MNKLGMCDCESQICEDGAVHEAGSCSSEAVLRIKTYGNFQNLCEDCHESAQAVRRLRRGKEYIVIEDRRYK